MGWPLVLYDGLALHRKPLWLQSVYIMKRDSPQKRAFFDDESPRRRMLLDEMVELLGQGVHIECESLSAAFLAEYRRFSRPLLVGKSGKCLHILTSQAWHVSLECSKAWYVVEPRLSTQHKFFVLQSLVSLLSHGGATAGEIVEFHMRIKQMCFAANFALKVAG